MAKKKSKPRKSKKFIPQASIVSDELYIPNLSGEHTAGTTDTPISDRQIANKKYVDDSFPVTHASTTGQTTDDHHAETHAIVSHDTTTTGAQLDTAYTHSQDNSQAHSDYMLNTGDTASGDYTFSGNVGVGAAPIAGYALSSTGNFQVYGTGVDVISMIHEDAGTHDAKLRFRRGGDDWYVGMIDSADLTFMFETGAKMTIDSATGNVGIGTETPEGKLDIRQGTSEFNLVVGANVSGGGLTNNARKFSRIGMHHYINAEEPVGLIVGDSNGTENIVYIGGGSSAVNAATKIQFRTSGNDTTTIGSIRMTIKSDGKVGILNVNPTYELDVTGRMRSTLGRVPAGKVHGANKTLNELFDALKGSVPSTNDEVIVNGSYEHSGAFGVFSYAKRTDATHIVVYLVTTAGAATGLTLIDGDGTTIDAISISW